MMTLSSSMSLLTTLKNVPWGFHVLERVHSFSK